MAAVQRGRVKALNSVKSLYFICSEMYASVILHQSEGKGLDVVCFNFPLMMKSYIDSRHRNLILDHTITLLTPSALVRKYHTK